MKHLIKQKSIICLLLFILLLICVFAFSGCQSTDKTNSYFDSSELEHAEFNYDSVNNKTKVVFSTTLTNKTIYNIEELSIKFELYSNGSLVGTKTGSYTCFVGHGKEYMGNFTFSVEGKIDSIQYISWHAEYASLWNSYKSWFIGTIICSVVVFLIATVAIIVTDSDIDDVPYFFEDHAWVLYSLLFISITTGIIGWLVSNWVSLCIIAGGLIGVILLIGLVFLIKYIFDYTIIDGEYIGWTILALILVGGFVCGCIFWKWWACVLILLGAAAIIAGIRLALFFIDLKWHNRESGKQYKTNNNHEYFDTNIEKVEDYLTDKKHLTLFKSSRLREYCIDNNIPGYSPELKKDEVVHLILQHNSEIDGAKNNSEKEKTDAAPTVKKQKTALSANSNGKTKQHKITFDDIAGLDEAKNAFKEKVVMALMHKDLYEKYGKKAGGGILLYGLPGTGKTMFAEAASNETDALFIPIKCSDIKSKWYGESEDNVQKIFAKARNAKKAIIFFDEFEAIGAKRTDNSDNANNDLVPQILAEMQGIGTRNSDSIIVVLAATNKPWAIDSAFLRPGRFDEKIFIPLPDFEARKKLFELKLKSIPQENLNYACLAAFTDGFNGADIEAFCDKLKMLAITESIETGTECPITMQLAEQAHLSVKSSVSDEDIDKLKNFQKTYG